MMTPRLGRSGRKAESEATADVARPACTNLAHPPTEDPPPSRGLLYKERGRLVRGAAVGSALEGEGRAWVAG